MPRAFPSQIVGYLTEVFKRREEFGHAVIYSKIGAVAGFLELYDQLPHELVRLSAADYAALVAAIGTVRFHTTRFGPGSSADFLKPVGKALSKAWELIEKLPDEVPSMAHDLSFVSDTELREMIGLDMAAISSDLQSGEWKGATILAGSCCEALLLYGLQTVETRKSGTIAAAVPAIFKGKVPNASDLIDRSWDLFSYAEIARHIGLISDNTKSELGPARDYRNLIHPAKSIREKVRCDRGTAFVGAGAVDHVISDLRRNL